MASKNKNYKIKTIRGDVSNIVDGDTIDIDVKYGILRKDSETIRIRFAGIDAPELTSNQPFADVARNFVASKVFGRKVYVNIGKKRSGQYITGKHGRTIGVVRLRKSGKSLNEMLVAAGLAKVYPAARCDFITDGLHDKLRGCENIAKRKKLGVWRPHAKIKADKKVGSRWAKVSKGIIWLAALAILYYLSR